MRRADIRTTMNVYGDAVTADMGETHGKIVGVALNRLQTDRKPSKCFRHGERGRNRNRHIAANSELNRAQLANPGFLSLW